MRHVCAAHALAADAGAGKEMDGRTPNEEPLLYDTFPDDFFFGVATSAFQVTIIIVKHIMYGII